MHGDVMTLNRGPNRTRCLFSKINVSWARETEKHNQMASPKQRPRATFLHNPVFQPSSLKAHARVHSDERPFACDKCPQAFKGASTLRNHIRAVHSSKYRVQNRYCRPAVSNWFCSASMGEQWVSANMDRECAFVS